MIQTVPLGTKCRVVLNYDPALQKVTIDTFIDKSGTDGVQERTMREIAEPNSCETKKMFLYGMSKNLETGAIEIYPMNGDAITIHGEAEAKFFTQRIMEYFQ